MSVRRFAVVPVLPMLFLLGGPRPVAAGSPAVAPTADPATVEAKPDAQALYVSSCVRCHGSEVYTRPDRKIGSYAALGRQVRQCETNLGLHWFDDESNAVVDFLNRTYYRFAP